MRIWMGRILAAVLVMTLLLSGSAVSATELPATEPTETLPETAVATEATQPEETEPAETQPEETEPPAYVIDTESEIYGICDALASEMEYDQLLVYDATGDEIFYAHSREGDKLYPASVTKLFSAYVALQHLSPDDVITVGAERDLTKPGSSVAYIGKGQTLYVKHVIEGMMLPSGNDAAIILATAAGRRIAEDETLEPVQAVETFVREMNRMADELGFERSLFANPDGWHVGCHYTCLNDMARIAKLALEDKTISRYIRKSKDEVTFLSGHTVEWENTNLLLNPEEGFYRGDAIGMKTGYTRQAEYCLMSAFKCKDGRQLVIGVFGYADEYQRFRDVITLAKACKELLQ